jgi:hypothetical protein
MSRGIILVVLLLLMSQIGKIKMKMDLLFGVVEEKKFIH